MDEKNKLVYKGIEESGFAILASRLHHFIESNTLHYLYFSGEIGSGKTSYIRILLKHIGINENIKSPSFNMVEHYETERKTIYHVDLFRMGSPTAWLDGEIGSLFEEENTLIFDPLRKKYLCLTPEEWVRQNFIQFLIQEKKYPISLMAIEKKIPLLILISGTLPVGVPNSILPCLSIK